MPLTMSRSGSRHQIEHCYTPVRMVQERNTEMQNSLRSSRRCSAACTSCLAWRSISREAVYVWKASWLSCCARANLALAPRRICPMTNVPVRIRSHIEVIRWRSRDDCASCTSQSTLPWDDVGDAPMPRM